jgi:RNA 3'-terminal phosphate cyclase (ATP)
MISIDGSFGEGGGQIVRTALALSLVTGKPFSMSNIRAGRKKPGLMRQHLTALLAAAEIGGARTKGGDIGSKAFVFEPVAVSSGRYRYGIGSAGSCTLVLQTVLPALIVADGPSEVTLEGGTHNPFAPPFDFLEKAFVPMVNKMGAKVAVALEKPGFYPAGGGKIRADIEPAKRLSGFRLLERGAVVSRKARAAVSNLSMNIARRELKVVAEKLGWERECLEAVEVKNARGPGNVLTLEIESENTTEVFTGFGEKGVPAEKVAERTTKQAKQYLASGVPVGRYLADQLLILLAMAGEGAFRTLTPTSHARTNIEIVKKFLDVDVGMKECEKDRWNIEIA